MTPTDILGRYDREARTRTDGMAPGFHVEWDGPVLRMTGPDATAQPMTWNAPPSRAV